ncbi:diaminopimelate decarboxylase [Thermosporothrix hazakensis]|jgi:diaminopimelate decarboxylase|uniref:Diaminopimelate decarboxylase n=1 Tax=Thermosporothrix hazakensis TaxID=644383 RepID=A0A326UC66_THEHA|nr:diaminopimelate decarboxylase [Thermosporothrix hazakensis]PZW36087.1 diaminopimelate decarboxylase [Thermosporothrix hazakensis]GCE46738.1 diaminopimelate decarboxylase [Thermosporothrix hazakensis]
MAVSLSPAQRALLPDTMSVSASDPFTLELAGHSLKQLAERYGTPLYIFDRATIVNACAQYREAFRREYQASSVQILYASKAYLSPMLARLIAEEGLGLDVVSGGELLVAHRAAFPMERISFHGNNKSAEELRLALRLGVGRIVLDNWSELRRLTQIAREMQMHPGVLVRVAPDVETDTHRYLQTGHATAKFGFPLSTGDAAEAVRTILREGQLHLLGLHAHSGTMLRETRPYEECLQRLLELAVLLHKETGWWPQELSPGGGWAIATPDAPDRPDPALLAAALQRCILHCVDTLKISQPLPMLIIEPGRSIIARAGIALYRIGARKATPGGITYLFVDGGMADNIRPALYGALYTALPVEQLEREHDVSFCVSGRYCESGDMLIEEVRLPDMREGELLLLPTAGAYCLPMASNYNLVPRPGVLLVDKETIHVMERRETYDDLLSRYCD